MLIAAADDDKLDAIKYCSKDLNRRRRCAHKHSLRITGFVDAKDFRNVDR